MTGAIINQLYSALENEVRQLVDLPVCVDHDRLKPGYLYNEALALELCYSVCLVMVYTPTYFDKDHTYCTREFKGMEQLEAERLRRVTLGPEARSRGLIIPVVFRGVTRLPGEISQKRHYEDFEKFALGEPRLSRHPKFKGRIRVIAEYIAERHETLKSCGADACGECANFQLPSDDDVREWLKTAAPKPLEFPGHEEDA